MNQQVKISQQEVEGFLSDFRQAVDQLNRLLNEQEEVMGEFFAPTHSKS